MNEKGKLNSKGKFVQCFFLSSIHFSVGSKQTKSNASLGNENNPFLRKLQTFGPSFIQGENIRNSR